jgi:hypothetical protein
MTGSLSMVLHLAKDNGLHDEPAKAGEFTLDSGYFYAYNAI